MRPRLVLLLLATVLVVVAGPPLATAGTSGISPPGANDWSCTPTDERPNPVVLVHGTMENMAKSWTTLSTRLRSRGYCVFALDYGNNATGSIPDSAGELASFVERVRGATGADKVDLVGHSQGGMMPRYYIKFLGGEAKVENLVGIVPSNHGTESPITDLPWSDIGLCPACEEQRAGSDFLTELNAGDEAPEGPDYTVIATKYDLVVTPYTSSFLAGPAERVTNITLQDRCPLTLVEHDQSPNDQVVHQWVLNALERTGPADPDFAPACTV
ncbi:esterase/lipase family protein [Allosalinactinospora lopnorensis]|uniref:esterase/lipase family protein n=1 Tax=Allosalinactinospora lopnorensis TaxID=1352348 RepID=UPI0006989BE6|nr:alpha/beta fold hydrolase [Allosalinactinospora lopnorensis]